MPFLVGRVVEMQPSIRAPEGRGTQASCSILSSRCPCKVHNTPNQTWQTYSGPGWKSLTLFFNAFYLCVLYFSFLFLAVPNSMHVLVP